MPKTPEMKKYLHPLSNQRGVTLMVVLLMMVIIGLAAGMAGNTWRNVMQREREEELLFRGDQYRRAIESYYNGGGQKVAKGALPKSIDDLIKDPRALQKVRHLREAYKDPFTGEPFEIVQSGGKITGLPGASKSLAGISGVNSASKLRPFKQKGFSEPYEKFDNAETYSDWQFVFTPTTGKKTGTTSQPRTPGLGQPALPGSTMFPGSSGSPGTDNPFGSPSGPINTDNPFDD